MKVEPRSPHFQDLPDAIKRALAIEPDRRSGTIRDVDHVVILMQENRSFDHYFGTLPGVRGFADPHPAPTPGGDVLTQAGDGIRTGPYALQPEHRSDTPVGYITPHTWDDAQRAWNDGRMDQWLPARGRLGMGAYGPAELPFQTALADAFTLCEAYHCSMQAGTNPNRLFLWTGANDPRAARPAARPWSTPMTASAPPPRAMPGPPIPNGCSRPAWTGASIRTWPTTSTTTPGRLSPIPRGACRRR